MGVPRLIAFLRPYAASVNLADASAVVIDGPGLAYHVWHICLAAQPRFRSAFEAIPSYETLGKTVVRFLDELQAYDVCVKKIFFDGHLPSTKHNTRLDRLVGYTRQLNIYHQSWPQIIPSTYPDAASKQSAVKLFNVEAVPSSFSRLPAAPFLVPAVIEMLLTSERYGGTVEVVPGEADAYCARYLQTCGGTVLTGDSDLLVHDLGGGAVTFFRDIERVENGDSECLMSAQYKVGDIVDRLSLPKSHGMKSLAFEMNMNAHGSFRELLQQALKLCAVSCHDNSYQEFAAEYESHIDCRNIHSTPGRSHVPAISGSLKTIDPRVSEFLLQLPTFSRASGMSEAQLTASDVSRGTATVFLPFLLDCPSRTSAWEISTSVRQLAYALTNLILPSEEQASIVAEYRRLQNGTRGKELSIPTVQGVLEECTNIIDLINQIRDGIPGLPKDQFWRALAVYLDLASNIGSIKNILSTFMVSTPSPKLTWDGIHSFAQFHGCHYSFRILKQILGVVMSSGDSSLFPPVLSQLWGELESLPSIAELINLVDFTQSVGSPKEKEIISLASRILMIEPDVVKAEVVQKNRGRRKQKNGSKKKNQTLEQRKSSNKFDLLNIA